MHNIHYCAFCLFTYSKVKKNQKTWYYSRSLDTLDTDYWYIKKKFSFINIYNFLFFCFYNKIILTCTPSGNSSNNLQRLENSIPLNFMLHSIPYSYSYVSDDSFYFFCFWYYCWISVSRQYDLGFIFSQNRWSSLADRLAWMGCKVCRSFALSSSVGHQLSIWPHLSMIKGILVQKT